MTNNLLKQLSFWLDDTSGKQHLCFIISNISDDKNVLIVNMTTLYNERKADLSCILEVGDHPAIKHRSYIFYENARVFPAYKLLTKIINGSLRKDCKIDDGLLKRIQEGAKKSDFLPDELVEYFKYF